MTAGYSGKPLFQKLGLKPGLRAAVVDPPANYEAILGDRSPGITIKPGLRPGLDFIHVFVTAATDLESRLDAYRSAIEPDGMIWVSWPKRSSGRVTDLTEDVVRAAALTHGLVDVKVCAVDEVWSGLKLVVRVRDRPRKGRTK